METSFRYFEEVVRLGSIRRAAKQLHLSPSSISRQILKLEHALGVDLMVRDAQGARLTPAGELVARYVQSRSREFQRLKASIDSLKNLESGHVTICTVEGTIGGMLPNALGRFSRDYPGITYRVEVAGTDDVMLAVAEDRCDIGISFHPQPRSEVETIASFRQPLLAVMAANHPLAGRSLLDLDDILDQPIGLPDRSFGIRNLVDHVFKAEQMTINVRLETNSIDMVRQFALEGMGIVFLPSFSFGREYQSGGLIGVPLANGALSASSMHVCKRAESDLVLPARRLVDYLIAATREAEAVA